jgi:hypothetical protein
VADRDAAALAYAVRGLLPLVHVPPRGIWGESGPVALTTVEAWLGRGVARDRGPDEAVLRYLAAFGPATVADARTWSGLGGLREVFERLRPRLRTFRDERGRELFDVPGAPLPNPETPAPAALFAHVDNALLSHADRARIVSDEHRKALSKDPLMRGVLLDGFACGTWKMERIGGKVTLAIEPFERLPAEDRDDLVREGERLLRFVAGPEGAGELEVWLTGDLEATEGCAAAKSSPTLPARRTRTPRLAPRGLRGYRAGDPERKRRSLSERESNPPVSTGRGDDGTTTLLGSGRMEKSDPRIVVLGDVDEASSFLGLARVEATRRWAGCS